MKTERLFLADIETGERHRALIPEKVAAIKASIASIGLRTPITVTVHREGDDWRFRLVAGAHRAEALRQLGEDMVSAFVMEADADEAELWEIDENFARAELTPLQRADHHERREAILVRRGEVQTHGGDRRSNGQSVHLNSYAKRAADELGVDERTVRRDLRRAKNIDPELRREIEGTDLDTGSVADALASEPPEKQRELLTAIRLQRSTPAPEPLSDGEVLENCVKALLALWNRTPPEARQEFLLRIEAPVFDKGRAA